MGHVARMQAKRKPEYRAVLRDVNTNRRTKLKCILKAKIWGLD
jgi:hypothetical protein